MPRPAVPANRAELPDEELLKFWLADLPIRVEGTILESRIAQLRAELDARDLRFPFHVYVSSEWFTPDGSVSMAVPFYLTHSRLERLEKAQMLEVEGGDYDLVHAHPPSRGGAPRGQRVPAQAQAPSPRAVRPLIPALRRVLRSQTVQ